MKIKDIFLSWDIITAVILTITVSFFTPSILNGQFTKEIYSLAVSTLTIIFSVFFAALAIIIASINDDFVRFLEEDGHYTAILSTFKYTLILLSISLVISIIFFGITSYSLVHHVPMQYKLFFLVHTFFFLYSLFSVFNASLDAFTFSKYRVEFLQIKNLKHD